MSQFDVLFVMLASLCLAAGLAMFRLGERPATLHALRVLLLALAGLFLLLGAQAPALCLLPLGMLGLLPRRRAARAGEEPAPAPLLGPRAAAFVSLASLLLLGLLIHAAEPSLLATVSSPDEWPSLLHLCASRHALPCVLTIVLAWVLGFAAPGREASP